MTSSIGSSIGSTNAESACTPNCLVCAERCCRCFARDCSSSAGNSGHPQDSPQERGCCSSRGRAANSRGASNGAALSRKQLSLPLLIHSLHRSGPVWRMLRAPCAKPILQRGIFIPRTSMSDAKLKSGANTQHCRSLCCDLLDTHVQAAKRDTLSHESLKALRQAP